MKLLKINDINLGEPLFLQGGLISSKVSANALRAIDGTEILFTQMTQNREFVFSSEGISWFEREIIDQLIALGDDLSLPELVLISDEGVINARFDYANPPYVSAEPLWVGSEFYYLTLKFKEV